MKVLTKSIFTNLETITYNLNRNKFKHQDHKLPNRPFKTSYKLSTKKYEKNNLNCIHTSSNKQHMKFLAFPK